MIDTIDFNARLSGTGPAKKPDEAKLEKACAEMESFFIHSMLKAMRATVPKSGLLGKSGAEERYTSMLDGQLAVELSSSGGIGLARELAGQFAAARGFYEDGLKS